MLPEGRSALALALLLALATAASAHSPHDVVKQIAVSPDYAQDQTILAHVKLTTSALFARSTDGGRSWQEYARPLLGEEIQALVFSPDFANDQTVFAATEQGVWRSEDGGFQWVAVKTGLPGVSVTGVAPSPAFRVDDTLLAATESGLYRSTDRGDTWVPITSGLTEAITTVVAFAPDDPDTAFIGWKTIHRTDDGGLSWTPVNTFAKVMESIAVSPGFSTDGTAAVSFGRNGDGVFFTTDFGASWIQNLAGLTEPFVNSVALADDGTLFAVTKTAAAFRVDTVAATWTLFSDGFEPISSLTDDHYAEIAVSPTFGVDGTVFVASYEGFFKSTDRGETWAQENVYHQRINRRMIVSPDYARDGTVFFGNYGGGMFSWCDCPFGAEPPTLRGGAGPGGGAGGGSGGPGLAGDASASGPAPDPLPSGETWASHATDIQSLWSAAIAVSPGFATDRTLFYGFAGLFRSTDAGASWQALSSPIQITRSLGMSPNFLRDRSVIVGSTGEGTFLSTDAGDSWTELANGFPPEMHAKVIVFSPDYAADATIFVASREDGIWRSTDGGSTWTAASAGLGDPFVCALDASPDFAADGLLLAGTNGAGLFRSTDGGDSWTPVGADLPSGTDNVIESVAFSPDFAVDGTAYASSLYDGLFRSTDGGLTWDPVNAGLPLSAQRVVAVSPNFARDDTVFLSTHSWVWRSQDRGDSWSPLSGRIRVDENHPTVIKDASWALTPQPGSNGFTTLVSQQLGATIRLEFRGRDVTWYGVTDTASGIADVYIDDVPVASIDLYSASQVIGAPLFTRKFPNTGWHTIRVEVTGTQAARSGGAKITSDGFAYSF